MFFFDELGANLRGASLHELKMSTARKDNAKKFALSFQTQSPTTLVHGNMNPRVWVWDISTNQSNPDDMGFFTI